MKDIGALIPRARKREQLAATLRDCNTLSARFGLTLSGADIQILAEKQAETLRVTGRIEFGPGPYEKLIYAFCDSPYLTGADYAGTLAGLCDLFYRYKSESVERWSDDELIELMKRLYDGECQGSLDFVGDRLWQSLHSSSGEDEYMEGDEELEEE